MTVWHLLDYILHDIDGVCYDVDGPACGHNTGHGYYGVRDPELVTCKSCIHTEDYKWAADHRCCTAP